MTEGPIYYTRLSEANLARQKEWDKQGKVDLPYRTNELGGEAGEALEAMIMMLISSGKLQNLSKKIQRELNGMVGSRTRPADLMKELGDVVICAHLCAMHLGEDLDAYVIRKFNETSEKYGLRTRLG